MRKGGKWCKCSKGEGHTVIGKKIFFCFIFVFLIKQRIQY